MRCWKCDLAYSLLELLVAAALSMVMTSVALPLGLSAIDRVRAAGAARFVASQLQRARVEAVRRSVHTGVRFTQDERGYRSALYVDGNGNGLRSADIARGVDAPLTAEERLEDRFASVRYGIGPGVTEIDSDLTLSGEPIQIGRTRILSFSPLGSATSGTLYILGGGRQQFAVRVLGATGRTRVLKYDFGASQWAAP
jgi:type II secretory pathway pseudopilin PulG